MSTIEVGTTQDGTVIYQVPHSPAELPPVLKRDLLRAWEAARRAALAEQPGPGRAFRFARPDGGVTAMALTDRDAQCWAGAADATQPLSGLYGLSVCLRLLALIELLTAAAWAKPYARVTRTGTELDPALLRLAAEAMLGDDGHFDARALRASLARLPNPARGAAGTGAPA
jgi:hypothetical protein